MPTPSPSSPVSGVGAGTKRTLVRLPVPELFDTASVGNAQVLTAGDLVFIAGQAGLDNQLANLTHLGASTEIRREIMARRCPPAPPPRSPRRPCPACTSRSPPSQSTPPHDRRRPAGRTPPAHHRLQLGPHHRRLPLPTSEPHHNHRLRRAAHPGSDQHAYPARPHTITAPSSPRGRNHTRRRHMTTNEQTNELQHLEGPPRTTPPTSPRPNTRCLDDPGPRWLVWQHSLFRLSRLDPVLARRVKADYDCDSGGAVTVPAATTLLCPRR